MFLSGNNGLRNILHIQTDSVYIDTYIIKEIFVDETLS
jgi:hypothetical protein